MPRTRATLTDLFATLLLVTTLGVFGCGRRAPEPNVADPAARRVTPAGEVVGFAARYDSYAWLGIPYAKPPVGSLRWRAPQPPDAWTGTRESLAFGSPCMQYPSPMFGVSGAREDEPVGSEDCLYLNVWTPRFAPAQVPTGAARLPVMVWIHGGGNTIGEGGFYNGGNLAASQKLVVITFNYRLGPLGWFRHAALRDDGATDLDRSGNFGTLDLVRALQWVQENVGAFGGDPGNVTIFGESAGGTNVFTLLLSPQARGLFHRAIVESGGLRMSGVTAAERFTDDPEPGDASSSIEVLARLLAADKSADDHAAAKARVRSMGDADAEHYLRGKTGAQILSAYTPMPGMGMIDMPKVFRDGVVLPDGDPMQRFTHADGYNAVPVMLGTNREENKLFMFGDPARVRRILWILRRVRDERSYNLTAEYLAKMWKANGADEPAARMRAAQGPSVFVFRFDWHEEPTILGSDLSVLLGAAHGFEIPFVFGHFDLGRNGNVLFTAQNEAGRLALAKQMMSYWAQFAYSGAPDRGRNGTLPAWTSWDDSSPASPKFMVLDTPAGGGPRMSSESVTQASVLAAVDDDPRLPTQRDKCRIFHDLAAWSATFTKKDYPTAGRQGCAAYPFETYPWES
ncbi:MAG TPA: carboxylesterase family protein [Candidatus Acidoferrales bacterium]|nr:carboxylesterase family protein [Candidatus Acidoferrales bacterium]